MGCEDDDTCEDIRYGKKIRSRNKSLWKKSSQYPCILLTGGKNQTHWSFAPRPLCGGCQSFCPGSLFEPKQRTLVRRGETAACPGQCGQLLLSLADCCFGVRTGIWQGREFLCGGNPKQTVYAFHSRQWHRWGQNNGKSSEGNTSNLNNRTLGMESEYLQLLSSARPHALPCIRCWNALHSRLGGSWTYESSNAPLSTFHLRNNKHTNIHTRGNSAHTSPRSFIRTHCVFPGVSEKKSLENEHFRGGKKKRTKLNLAKEVRLSEVKKNITIKLAKRQNERILVRVAYEKEKTWPRDFWFFGSSCLVHILVACAQSTNCFKGLKLFSLKHLLYQNKTAVIFAPRDLRQLF